MNLPYQPDRRSPILDGYAPLSPPRKDAEFRLRPIKRGISLLSGRREIWAPIAAQM